MSIFKCKFTKLPTNYPFFGRFYSNFANYTANIAKQSTQICTFALVMKKIIYFYAILVALMSSCTSHNDYGKITIVRTDEMCMTDRLDSAQKYLGPFLEVMSSQMGMRLDIENYSKSRAMMIFGKDVNKYLLPLDSVERVLAQMNGKAKELKVNIANKHYVGVINSYSQPIMVIDSIVYIGLNHYLGSNYAGYTAFADYIKKVKTISHMPFDVAESSLAYCYPYLRQSDETAINRMLYEGALLYTILELMPDADVFDILLYSDTEIDFVKENESKIWAALAARDFLYSTDRIIIAKLCQPSPSSSYLHDGCPAMIGRYIGYKIVKSYLKNNEVPELSFILSPSFYNSKNSLLKSKYSPH